MEERHPARESDDTPDRDAHSAARTREAARLWLENESLIRQVIWYVTQRVKVAWDDREDFAQEVHLRFVDGARSPLLSFKGGCRLKSYLTIVITNMAKDFVTSKKWRPSAQATALGRWCVRLEQLVHRDGAGLHEAVQIVNFEAKGDVSECEILGWYGALPVRRPWGPPVGEGPLDLVAGRGDPVKELEEEERRERLRLIVARCEAHLSDLSDEDATMIRLRFLNGLTLKDIERVVGVPFRRVHERIKKGLKTVRKTLKAEGIGGEEDIDLLIWSIGSRTW